MSALTHLQRLEAEAIHIMREVVAETRAPVMLYSAGKDSAVMLHLARKAFHPSAPPFPLLHVDTTWKFGEMYAVRDKSAADAGMELLVWQNAEAKERGINPFDHGALHTDMWKTQGLKQALDHYGFDARKAPGESIRAFPLSNWTELDIWQYIMAEGIEIASLYFASPRPVVERDGMLLMVEDERFPLADGEQPEMRSVRFRTLGCYPLTGAVESEAATVRDVVQEMLLTTSSERQGRAIDKDEGGAGMEKKKAEGYF